MSPERLAAIRREAHRASSQGNVWLLRKMLREALEYQQQTQQRLDALVYRERVDAEGDDLCSRIVRRIKEAKEQAA